MFCSSWNYRTLIACFAALTAGVTSAIAAPLTGGDYLLTDAHTRTVSEYRSDGTLVQSFGVSAEPGQDDSDPSIRDVVVDGRGNLHVFAGTFDPVISNLDVLTGTWTHTRLPDFSLENNVTYGKLAIWNDYLFTTTQTNALNVNNGIIRIDLRDGSSIRFAPQGSNDGPVDLTIGENGLLYALNGEGSPSGRFIESFDPTSLVRQSRTDLPTDFVFNVGIASRQLHVDAAGNYYLNQLYGPIYKLSPSLNVLATYAYPHSSYVDDMDFREDGTVLIAQADGRAILLDSGFNAIGDYPGSYYFERSFGAWVPSTVPEPTSLAALALGAATVLSRRRNRYSKAS